MKFSCLFSLFAVAVTLTACSGKTDGSMLSDGIGNATCPGGCADTTSKSTDTKLTLNTATRYVTAGTRVEIQGDCFASTYTDNYIVLSYTRNGTVIAAPTSSNMTVNGSGLLSCVNGKFYFMFDSSSWSAANYNVIGQMYVKSGTTYTAPTTAKFTLPVVVTP